MHAVFFEDAAFGKLDGEIQSRLAADGGQQGIGTLRRDDGFEIFFRERLDVGAVGGFGVRHHRGRIRIDEHHFVAFRAQGLAGLGAGVVEFAGLPDDDRAGADDEDFLDVSAFRHWSIRGAACEPGFLISPSTPSPVIPSERGICFSRGYGGTHSPIKSTHVGL